MCLQLSERLNWAQWHKPILENSVILHFSETLLSSFNTFDVFPEPVG